MPFKVICIGNCFVKITGWISPWLDFPGIWSRGMQVGSLGWNRVKISLEGQHSQQSAELHALLWKLEFASCHLRNSLPCLTAATPWTGFHTKQARFPANRPPLPSSHKGRRLKRALPPCFHEFRTAVFSAQCNFPAGTFPPRDFFSLPAHTDLLPDFGSYLNSLSFLPLQQNGSTLCGRWQKHLRLRGQRCS